MSIVHRVCDETIRLTNKALSQRVLQLSKDKHNFPCIWSVPDYTCCADSELYLNRKPLRDLLPWKQSHQVINSNDHHSSVLLPLPQFITSC